MMDGEISVFYHFFKRKKSIGSFFKKDSTPFTLPTDSSAVCLLKTTHLNYN